MYSRILSFPFTPYLVIFHMKGDENRRVGFFLINFVYKTDMTVLHRKHNSLLGQMHLTSHIWAPWMCLLSSLSSYAAGSEAHLQLPNAHWPPPHTRRHRRHPNPFFKHLSSWCTLTRVLQGWRTCPVRTGVCIPCLWKQALTRALPAPWDCIYKLNERDNRCFHVISRGTEW